jgi:hypothetical protein
MNKCDRCKGLATVIASIVREKDGWRSVNQVPTYFVYIDGRSFQKIAEKEAMFYAELSQEITEVYATVVDINHVHQSASYSFIKSNKAEDKKEAEVAYKTSKEESSTDSKPEFEAKNPMWGMPKIMQNQPGEPEQPVQPIQPSQKPKIKDPDLEKTFMEKTHEKYIKNITEKIKSVNSNMQFGDKIILGIASNSHIEILKAAVAAAKLKAEQTEDNGTCNLDAAYIPVPKEIKVTERFEKIVCEHLEKVIGGYCYYTSSGFHGRRFMININVGGQADKRAQAVQVFSKFLRDRGFACGVYYQMD